MIKKAEYWKGKKPPDKLIFDLCGGTGSWSRPYKEAGYDVRVITLPGNDVFDWWDYLDPEFLERIYGILAAPDCAHFSLARNGQKKTPRDIPGAFRLVDRCLAIIKHCVIFGNCRFWALENPKGLLRQILGKPGLTFEACWYGDPWLKKTDLWGFFESPELAPCDISEIDRNFINKGAWHKVEIPSDYKRPPGMDLKAIKRAITPPGFARAFFNANK